MDLPSNARRPLGTLGSSAGVGLTLTPAYHSQHPAGKPLGETEFGRQRHDPLKGRFGRRARWAETDLPAESPPFTPVQRYFGKRLQSGDCVVELGGFEFQTRLLS